MGIFWLTLNNTGNGGGSHFPRFFTVSPNVDMVDCDLELASYAMTFTSGGTTTGLNSISVVLINIQDITTNALNTVGVNGMSGIPLFRIPNNPNDLASATSSGTVQMAAPYRIGSVEHVSNNLRVSVIALDTLGNEVTATQSLTSISLCFNITARHFTS